MIGKSNNFDALSILITARFDELTTPLSTDYLSRRNNQDIMPLSGMLFDQLVLLIGPVVHVVVREADVRYFHA